MEIIIKYFVIFVLFSFLGWLYEYMLFNRNIPFEATKKLFGINLYLLPIYGVGGIILLFIYENIRQYGILVSVISAVLLLNSMECISGLLSYNFYHYKTWNYSETLIPFCYGYTSIVTAIWWGFLSYLFFVFMDFVKKNMFI